MQFSSESMSFSGMYRGVVVNNDDPNKNGRCRVRVHCVFGLVEDDHLPWAVPALPLFTGAGNDYGWFGIPEVGSEVFVFFEESDFNQPVFFAEAVTGVHGHPSVGDTNYPDRRGFQTPSGHKFYVDDEDDEIQIEHSDGNKIQIAESLINASHNSGSTIQITDTKISATHSDGGEIEISSASIIVQIGSAILTLYPSGNIVISGGTISVTGTGDMTVSTSGNIEISGAKVDINP